MMCAQPLSVLTTGLTLLLSCGGLIGCGGESLNNRLEALSQPTGALASGDAELVSRVQALAADRALSHQLDGPLGPAEENTAAALSGAYGASLHFKIAADLEKFADPSADLKERAAFLRKHAELADKTAAAADLSRCRWDVQHRLGFFSRMIYLDDANTAVRLMLVRAIDSAINSRLPDSLADLRRALHLAHELASVKRVEARVRAASLRAEALYVAYVLFEQGIYERFEAETLLNETIRNHLADWPRDSRMLVGERATIIHAYEAIRAGMLDRVLLPSEKARLRELGVLALLEAATPPAISADQVRCLDTLAELIESAGAVGPDRRAAIERAMSNLGEGPRLFASHVFTPDLPDAVRLVAEDRARTEAWALALAGIAKLKTPPFRTSPLTGQPYVAEQPDGHLAIVYGAKADQRVVLRLLNQ